MQPMRWLRAMKPTTLRSAHSRCPKKRHAVSLRLALTISADPEARTIRGGESLLAWPTESLCGVVQYQDPIITRSTYTRRSERPRAFVGNFAGRLRRAFAWVIPPYLQRGAGQHAKAQCDRLARICVRKQITG